MLKEKTAADLTADKIIAEKCFNSFCDNERQSIKAEAVKNLKMVPVEILLN